MRVHPLERGHRCRGHPYCLAPHEGGGFSGKAVNGLVAFADLPTGGRPEIYRDPTLFSPSELCACFLNQPGLNDTLRNALLTRIRPKLPGGLGVHSQSNHITGKSCEARAELWPRSDLLPEADLAAVVATNRPLPPGPR